MKTPKVGNPVDPKTVTKDLATVAGIGAGAVAADVINSLEVVQKQDKDLVDGGLFVVGVGAGMALKGNDAVTAFFKMTGFTIGVSSAIRAYKRHTSMTAVAGQNSWLSRKRRGMNNSLIRSTAQRQASLAQRQYAPPAQPQNVFANAVIAQ